MRRLLVVVDGLDQEEPSPALWLCDLIRADLDPADPADVRDGSAADRQNWLLLHAILARAVDA